jgi:hypothetical protein
MRIMMEGHVAPRLRRLSYHRDVANVLEAEHPKAVAALPPAGSVA